MLKLVTGGKGQDPAPETCAQLPLKLNNVCYSIDGTTLLAGVDLEVASAGITAIMGPNGAGKSLLVRLAHALVQPTSGTVSWAGKKAGDATRKNQAMVFQKPVLLRRSVAANVDFVLRLSGSSSAERVAQLLEQAGLSGKAQQPARALSGGEQQRLALARALASDPEVLLLDEPTASLDPASTQIIETQVASASSGGIKVFLVTHDGAQAQRLAEDVVFMHRGRVEEYTPAKAFFSNPLTAEARDYLAGRLVL